MKEKGKMFVFGGIIGLIGTILVSRGNPGNMGICIACFWRDIAGALGLHRAAVVQYIRPEIIGIVGGAFIASLIGGDYKARGGSNPLVRFTLGFFTMVGALVFLGCPLRMILRLANGDLNAVVGLLGYVAGIGIGVFFLKKGYSLGKSMPQLKFSGLLIPLFVAVLLIFLVLKPSFIFFSEEGPGAKHAALLISLALGGVVGVVLQRSRICTAGAFRDLFIMKDAHYLWGILGMFVVGLVANLVLNPSGFKLGFAEQPVAHAEHLWNFLGMLLAGICSCLLGGCPIRQTVLSGQGDLDAGVTVLGLVTGAAFAHNFALASSGKGTTPNGRIAVIIGIIFALVVAFATINSSKKEG